MTLAEAPLPLIYQPLVAHPETPLLTVMAQMGGRDRIRSHPPSRKEGFPDSGIDPRAARREESWPRPDCVVVVEDGRVVGLVTLGDMGRLVAQHRPLERCTVGQVMSQPVISLPQGLLSQPSAILDLLHQHHIRHLPVVDDQGSLVGLMTQTSLLESIPPLELYQTLKSSPTQGAPQPPRPTMRRRSEAMMTKLAATVPGTLYVLEQPTAGVAHLTYVSPQALDLYGVSAEAMVQDGQRFFDLVHPEDRPHYWVALEMSAHTQEPFLYEYRIITPTGQEKWMRAHGQPDPLPQGGVRWFGVALDITDRKQAEDALLQVSRRLREAQRIAQMGNWELDLWTNTLYWSEEIYRIFELDSEQFEASYEAFLQMVHPEDRAFVHEAFNHHLWDRRPYKTVHRLQFPDGRIKYVQEQCETLYNDDGTPYLSLGTVQDVTELKQAEMALAELNADLERRVAQRTLALRQSEARYRQIIETANEGVWLLDAEAYHVLGNPTLLALIGQTPQSIAGTRFFHYLPEDRHSLVQALLDRCAAGQAEQVELPLRHRDGSLRWVLASVSPIFNPTGQYEGVLAMVTDITERRQAVEVIR